ncbi:hypothetical protein [Streptacidiphilus cavernicola]|uniref:Glycosyltransferase RgtA/B/C/D-like domain-containing protein n=1 Tax=Streptacidiphilus cavernicola TaxID=3342716 RepID=A0ABV6VTV8_9ACTN
MSRRSVPILLTALLASWLLPLLLGLLRLDVLLLPVLLLTLASVLRVGGVLLDRLVLAGFLLAGAMLVLALPASVWPWGPAPAPVAAVLLTLVSTAAWIGRRRPSLPWRFRGTDAIVVGTGLLSWYLVRRGASGGKGLGPYSGMMIGDRFTHFSIFDAIHRIGGYPFLLHAQAGPYMFSNSGDVYPQGSHMLLAWTDVFLRSSTGTGSPVAEFGRYCGYVVVAFAVLSAVLVWAARWVGGPRLRGWRAAAVCSVTASLVAASPLVKLLANGFDSEVVGLACFAVVLAVLLRPAMGRLEFVLLGCAGLVTVAYSYNLYAVLVGLALLASLWAFRARDSGRRLAVYGGLAVGSAVAVIPSVVSVLSSFNIATQAAAGGAIVPMSRPLIIGAGGVIVLAVLVAGRNRTPTERALLLAVAATAAVLLLFGGWQLHTLGKVSYYFEKLVSAAFVLLLVGLGVAGALLRPLVRAGAQDGLSLRLRQPALAAGSAAAALTLIAGFQWGVPSGGTLPSGAALPEVWQTTALAQWSDGGIPSRIDQTTYTFLARDLARVDPAAPVVTLYTDSGAQNWQTTYFAQTMLRNDVMMSQMVPVYSIPIGGTMRSPQVQRDALYQLRLLMRQLHRPATVLVGNAVLARQLDHDLNSAGHRAAAVVFAPLLR